MKQSKIMIYSFLLVPFLNCTNVSEDDLIEVAPLETVVTYTEQVKPIIDNNCISCHSNPPQNGAPMSLTNYDNVKNAIENRGLIARISTTEQSFLMPFGGPRLPQNLIDIIIEWEAQGFIEN